MNIEPRTSKIEDRTERASVRTSMSGIRCLMFDVFAVILFLFVPAAGSHAQQPVVEEPRIGFCAVDLYVDSQNTPLAAYQLEFAVTNGTAKIVGIEGGEHPAFHEPPFYDPRAIQRERVILAAFNTADASQLPSGRTRVATIHLQTIGTDTPQFELKLQAAADANGIRIPATAYFEQQRKQ